MEARDSLVGVDAVSGDFHVGHATEGEQEFDEMWPTASVTAARNMMLSACSHFSVQKNFCGASVHVLETTPPVFAPRCLKA